MKNILLDAVDTVDNPEVATKISLWNTDVIKSYADEYNIVTHLKEQFDLLYALTDGKVEGLTQKGTIETGVHQGKEVIVCYVRSAQTQNPEHKIKFLELRQGLFDLDTVWVHSDLVDLSDYELQEGFLQLVGLTEMKQFLADLLGSVKLNSYIRRLSSL